MAVPGTSGRTRRTRKAEQNSPSPPTRRFVAACRGPVVQHPCPGTGARVRRGAAKTGWNPALSRNREAPSGDESGRLPRGANDGPRRKGGLWAARTRPIAAPSDRKEGGWANVSASSLRSCSRLSVAACGSGGSTGRRASGRDGASPTSDTSSFPVTVEGTNGEITIDDRPERIVSLSPTATEDLFAIGAGEQVIAVDDQSNFPPEAPHDRVVRVRTQRGGDRGVRARPRRVRHRARGPRLLARRLWGSPPCSSTPLPRSRSRTTRSSSSDSRPATRTKPKRSSTTCARRSKGSYAGQILRPA